MKILSGIRVIDVTAFAFVPAAGGVLAHWGADVIKVENPKAQAGSVSPTSSGPGESGFLFKHYSRGKRSIAIDLTDVDGRELLYRLVETADVFLTSYLRETREKLRIDVADIRAHNPRIIYARGSGYGPKGPDAGRGGYDAATWWARGSLAHSAMASAGADTPPRMSGHGDGMSGMTLVSGICAALLQRERTGIASVVDGSLLGTAAWFNGVAIMSSKRAAPLRPAGAAHEGNYYRTKDDRFLYILMLGNTDTHWRDLCEHLERPELAADPRFATPRARVENRAAGIAALGEIFAQRMFADWKQVLATTLGVWAPVQTPEEMYDDPQCLANGFLRDVEYPSGPLTVPVPPILFDEDAGEPPPAPDFAAHTDAVLGELGLSPDEIRRLRSRAVVA